MNKNIDKIPVFSSKNHLFFLYILLFGLLTGCQFFSEGGKKEENGTSEGEKSSKTTENTYVFSEEDKKRGFQVLAIDSLYYLEKKRYAPTPTPIEELTDLEQVQSLLRSRVFFNEYNQVTKIVPKNGNPLTTKDFGEAFFVAYYPSEYILLCEGEETNEISFDLKTGKTTDEVGNPTYVIASPKGVYRLNGYNSGKGYCVYYIQKKEHTGYTSIIDISEDVHKEPINILEIPDAFFTSETEFYVKIHYLNKEDETISLFYRIKIIQ